MRDGALSGVAGDGGGSKLRRMENCPCGSGLDFTACCGPIIAGAPAATAEALMRSRYSAYVTHAYAHLGNTLSAEQRKDYSADDAKRWAESSEWLGLEIAPVSLGGPTDETGAVEFTARFKTEGQEHEHHEIAVFKREESRWVYAGQAAVPGQTVRRETPKPGRNDPCPCGSGKKYKKCCGAAA
jgi:SEC-C motif-containing protein